MFAPLGLSQIALSFALHKRLKNIPDPEEVIPGQQRLDIHAGDTFRPTKAKDSRICREILVTQMASLVGGGFSNVGPSRLMAHLLRFSEDSLKIILDL